MGTENSKEINHEDSEDIDKNSIFLKDLQSIFIEAIKQKKNKKIINILFLGKSGSGKTTLANVFANHFMKKTYKDERVMTESQSMILETFVDGIRTSKTYKFEKNIGEIEIETIKNEKLQSESQTEHSSIHKLSNESFEINLLDTPGLLDTRGFKEDIGNVQDTLAKITELAEIHAICLVQKSTDSRMDVAFKYYVEEIKSIIPEQALQNVFICFTHALNPNKVDGFSSLNEMGLPMNNVLIFENDCLVPHTFIEDEEDLSLNEIKWKRNEKNFNKLIEKCGEIAPFTSELFIPILLYKTIFYQADLAKSLEFFSDQFRLLQRIIFEIHDLFKKNNYFETLVQIILYFQKLLELRELFQKLSTYKYLYDGLFSTMFEGKSYPKNKYLKEYINFLEETKDLDKVQIQNLKSRIEFEEHVLNETFESELLEELLIGFDQNFKSKTLKYKKNPENKNIEICNEENNYRFSLNASDSEKPNFIVYSALEYGTFYIFHEKFVGSIISGQPKSGTRYFYSGSFSTFSGEYHGSGTTYTKNGDRIDGILTEQGFHGNIIYYFKNGGHVQSQFINGITNGSGTYVFSNGHRWVGSLNSNLAPNGNGTFYFGNNTYQGPFSGGSGTIYYSDGSKWIGNVENFAPMGCGTLYTDGNELYGNRNNTGFYGEVRLLKNGSYYYGYITNGVFNEK